jgi:hypothetical protein
MNRHCTTLDALLVAGLVLVPGALGAQGGAAAVDYESFVLPNGLRVI